MSDPSAVWYILAILLIIVGIAGTVLPALPGLPLVFGGMLLAAWADGFHRVGAVTLVVLGALTLLSIAVDFAATAMGAKRVGASRLAVVGAMIGTVVGLFAGFIGIFVGPFAGALAGELLHLRRLRMADMTQATRVGIATWVGMLVGIVLKLGLAFLMVGLFALVWVVNR